MKHSLITVATFAFSTISYASPVYPATFNDTSLVVRSLGEHEIWCTPSRASSTSQMTVLSPHDIATTLMWAEDLGNDKVQVHEYPKKYLDNGLHLNDCQGSPDDIMMIPIFSDGKKIYREENNPGQDYLIYDTKGTVCNVITSEGMTNGKYQDCRVADWDKRAVEESLSTRDNLKPRMAMPEYGVWCTDSMERTHEEIPQIDKETLEMTLAQILQEIFKRKRKTWKYPDDWDPKWGAVSLNDCVDTTEKIFYMPILPNGMLWYGENGYGFRKGKDAIEPLDFMIHTHSGKICNFVTSRGVGKDRYRDCVVLEWGQNPFEPGPF
jgi:hypothetical protein